MLGSVRSLLPLFVLFLGASAAPGANVRDFGARGDGRTDDTAAVEKAVAAGGTVVFERGTYRLTRTVVLDLARHGPVGLRGESGAVVVMAAAGPAFHFVGTHAGTAAPETFPPDFWETGRLPAVDGLAVQGGHPDSIGLRATGTMQLTVVRCHFRGLWHGIHLPARNRNVIIAACHIYDNRGIGVFLDQADLHQINIGDCHISYNRGGGIVARGGALRNLQIGNCDIEANQHPDSPPTANIHLDATGGSIGQVEITGCTIQHTRTAKGSANIRINARSRPSAATAELRHGDFVISGNLLSDADLNLHLLDARGVAISGNTIHFAGSHDVLIERCSSVVLSASVFDRNPRFRYGPNEEPAAHGIVIRDTDGVTLSGLHLFGSTGAAALALHQVRRATITGCSILEATNVGLLLEDVSASVITGCNISAANRPLQVVRGGDNLIGQNLLNGKP